MELTGDICLSFLSVGGILLLGVGLGYAICTILDRNPTTGLAQKLISNKEALDLIRNYQGPNYDKTAGGHIELGSLLAYIDKMKAECKAKNKKLSAASLTFP